MPISNSKVPSIKAPSFKSVNFRAPKVKIGIKSPKVGISVKPMRPSQIKVANKGIGQP